MCWDVNAFCALTPLISRSISLPLSPSISANLSSISVVLQTESRNATTCCVPVSSKMITGSTSTNEGPALLTHVQPDFKVHWRPPDEEEAPDPSRDLQFSLADASPSLIQ